ncbi:MAG TPA: gliding motility-associated C-terminal domain-containing protein [Bacteroidia bacterium]|nr:gliding motility-associated C-terminal domain-containing protein [Bacteroidia bacterium]
MKIFTIFFISFFFCSVSASAQSWNWARENIDPPHGEGDPLSNHCVAVDVFGSVYETGFYVDTLLFGTDTVLSYGGYGSYLVKYDMNGNLKWARGTNGIPKPETEPGGVSTDGTSDIYETGYFHNTAIFGTDTLYNTRSSWQMYLVKYDINGNVLWAKESSYASNGHNSCYGFDVASDFSGNAYVTGYFDSTVAFGTDTLKYTGDGDLQVFIVKYDPNGNVIWATGSSGKGDSYVPVSSSVAIDHLGNAYITGWFEDTLKFGANVLYHTKGTNSAFIAKFDKNGNALWARQSVNNTANASALGISIGVDALCNAYITGNFTYSVAFGADTLRNSTEDVFFNRYDSSGNLRWAKQGIPLSNSKWKGYSLACDTLPSGGGFIIMHGAGVPPIILQYGVDTFDLNTSSHSASVLFQFDSSGNVVCGSVTGEGGEDDNDGVAVDHAGRYIYIGGDLADTTVFGNDTLVYGNEAPFVARWNPCCIIAIHLSPIDTTICMGDSITLTASGAANYYWSPARGLNTTSDSTVITNTTVSTVYNVAGKSPGCIGFATVTVNVSHTTITITPPNDSVCKGQSTMLNASGALTYSWSPPSGLSCTTCSIPNVTPDSTITYSIVGIDVNGCKDSSKITVFVKPQPVAIITAFPSDSICIGDSVHLIGSGGGSYLWTPGSFTSNTIWVKPVANSTYSLSTSIGTCSSDTSIHIFMNPSPTVSITSDTTICNGGAITLVATGGGTYKWSTNSTASSILVIPSSTTTYTVGVSNGFCAKDTGTTITVNPIPVVSINPDTAICAGKGITLTVTGGGTYLWSNASTSSSISVTPSFTIIYTVVVTDNGCSKDTAVTVTVDSLPVVTITPPKKICPGNTVILMATGGGKYLWSTGATTDSISVSPTSTTTYSVTVSTGCKVTSSAVITVENPVIYACCDTTIFPGNSVSLNAGGSNIIHYLWTPSTGISCDTCPVVTVSPTVTTTYTVVGTDSLGCQTERILEIIVDIPCVGFNVPNVFTPDFAGQQGLNQVFYIKAENMSAWSIIIYDRWGKEMFRSGDPLSYWDGTTEGGSKAPDGVYYYIISATCQNNPYKKDGFVQLIR